VLNLAGVEIPSHVQGQPFLGRNLPPAREYVFGARDRMDERYDIIRMVRDQRFKYLRNYEPLKTYYQYINTCEKGATMHEIRSRHDARQLGSEIESYFSPPKPVEELYDTRSDPHEMTNLVDNPAHARTLARLRRAHLLWVKRTKDLGLISEPLLVAREKTVSHRYGILRQAGGDELAQRLADTAVAASAGESGMTRLVAALHDSDATVRYWGAVGMGNLGRIAEPSVSRLIELLGDGESTVRIAAARALCHLGMADRALPTLAAELECGSQWERLQSAIVLDEIGEQARPLLAPMHAALHPRSTLFANGKYTVRVINRALNELESTQRMVR